MTTDTVNTPLDFNDPQVLELIEGDEELKQLPLGSEDLQAAVSAKLAKTDETDASAGDGTEEETDESSEDDDESPEEQDGKKKPQRGILRRIEKLVVEKHSMQQRIAQLEAALQQGVQQNVEQAVGEFVFAEPEPRFDDYANLNDYIDARTEWKMAKAQAEYQHRQELAKLESEVMTVAKRWQSLEKEAKKSLPEYDEIVTPASVAAANPSQLAKEFLAESDYGPQIVYAILSDEKLFDEFSKASPAKQVKIQAKLEAKLEDSKSETAEPQKPSTASKAKLPAPLPKGKPSQVGLDLIKDADKMSDEEWSRLYEAQRRRR